MSIVEQISRFADLNVGSNLRHFISVAVRGSMMSRSLGRGYFFSNGARAYAYVKTMHLVGPQHNGEVMRRTGK
jgi:hypothetical protein